MEDQYVEKLAGFFGTMKKIFGNERVTSALGLGVALGIAGTLSEQISGVLQKEYRKYKSKDYFDNMLEMHPQLKAYPPEEIAKYWNSLNHFAPSVAAEPLAAGAYLTQSLKKLSGEELGGPPPDTFNTLADIHKKYSDSKSGGSKDKASSMFELVSKVSYDELKPRWDSADGSLIN